MNLFFNKTIERELLGQAMSRPEVTDRILADLTVEVFGEPAHKVIFNAIKKVRAEGHEADLASVSNEIKLAGYTDIASPVAVADIVIESSIIDENYHVAELKKLFKARRLYNECSLALSALEDSTENLPQISENIKDVLEMASPKAALLNPETIGSLMSKSFPAPRWAIEDLLPVGLGILAGAPKMGKSFLALDIAVAVSTGAKVLGEYQASKGEVLYLPLEDSERRLQSRLTMIAEESKISNNSNFYYQTEVAGLLSNGMSSLSRWLSKHPECRLVIIDTLQRIKPDTGKGMNAYESDYAFAGQLQQFALRHDIALLLIHHVRKQKADDVFDEVSGSSGLNGAADVVWVLKRDRTESNGTLTVTGRDIDEMKLAAEFNRETCRWVLLGDERQVTRRKDLVALQSEFSYEPFTFDRAKDALKVSIASAKRVVNDLVTSGHVERLSDKVGRAFQFRLTTKFSESILGGE